MRLNYIYLYITLKINIKGMQFYNEYFVAHVHSDWSLSTNKNMIHRDKKVCHAWKTYLSTFDRKKVQHVRISKSVKSAWDVTYAIA